MPVYDIYSKRKKRSEQTEAEVYQYDRIPETLRAQIQHIWDDAIGPCLDPGPSYWEPPPHNSEAWKTIRDCVCREKGLMTFAREPDPRRDCIAYLYGEKNAENLLDLVEFSFRYISQVMGERDRYELRKCGAKQTPSDVIAELNVRFREAGVGYQFEGDQIIRVDS